MASEIRLVSKDTVKVDATQVDILILTSHAPVIGGRVFQSATDHPPHLAFMGAAALIKLRSVYNKEFLMEIDLSKGEPTGYVWQPPAKCVAEAGAKRK